MDQKMNDNGNYNDNVNGNGNVKGGRSEINLKNLLRVFFGNKKRFAINMGVTFVLACAYILCIPRSYQAVVRLAPETDNSSGISSLSSIASSFGFDIGGAQSSDAISPDLYPDLFMTNDWAINMLKTPIQTLDGSVKTDYYDYLRNHQQQTPWAPAFKWVKNLFASKAEGGNGGGGVATLNPFQLSEIDNGVVLQVTTNITCSIDKTTNVIDIAVSDQDPLVAATLADTARVKLQEFITNYRTSKARRDLEYYQMLVDQAKADYQASVDAYGRYADSHQGNLLQSYQSRQDELENNMQLYFNTMTALQQQVQNAEAKVQERTPAFTILQNASVPVKANKPKRMIFVAFMTLLSGALTFLWLIRRNLLK